MQEPFKLQNRARYPEDPSKVSRAQSICSDALGSYPSERFASNRGLIPFMIREPYIEAVGRNPT